MSGTHTAKFLLYHYLFTLMGGWGMGGWRHNYMSGTHTTKFLLCHYLLTLMGGRVWVGGDIIT